MAVVASSVFWSSRFCCTSSSCAVAMAVNSFRISSTDLDQSRLFALRPRERDGEHAVSVRGRDAVRVQLHPHADGAIEAAGDALSAMHAGIIIIRDRFLARDPYGVASHLQAQIVLAHARHLDDCYEIASLLKNVDRRECASSGGHVFEPATLELL